MALYQGNNQVQKIYLGNQEVQKIYLGANEIYATSNTAPEPVGTDNTTPFGIFIESAVVQSLADELKTVLEETLEGYDIRVALNVDNGGTIPDTMEGRYRYSISTTGRARFRLTSATELGLRAAMAELLFQLGFRFYSPHEKWWIKPTQSQINQSEISILNEVPHYPSAVLWSGYGGYRESPALQTKLKRFLYLTSVGPKVLESTGHSWANIINRNATAFAANPNLYADPINDPNRLLQARDLALNNPDLIDLVIADRVALLEELRQSNPYAYMVSLDPRDGSTVTADDIAPMITAVANVLKPLGGWVGLYAYGKHDLPPTNPYPSNTYVQVAMAFNSTQFSYSQLVDMWQSKVGLVGLREYYGVMAWGGAMPGVMKVQRYSSNKNELADYFSNGAKGLNSETVPHWAGQWAGWHALQRLLKDTSIDVDDLVDEDNELAMEGDRDILELTQRWNNRTPFNSSSQLEYFDLLADANSRQHSSDVSARIADMMRYLIYAEKWRLTEESVARQYTKDSYEYKDALWDLLNYCWRIREDMCVHNYGVARRLANSNVSNRAPDNPTLSQLFAEIKLDYPGGASWKTGSRLSDIEIRSIFADLHANLQGSVATTTTYESEYGLVTSDLTGPTGGGDALTGRLEKPATVYIAGPASIEVIGLSASFSRWDGESIGTTTKTYEYPEGFFTISTSNVRVNINSARGFAHKSDPLSPTKFEPHTSNGHYYIYKPNGITELQFNNTVRLSLVLRQGESRIDFSPSDRLAGLEYMSVPVDAAGYRIQMHRLTRGVTRYFNIPPLVNWMHEAMILPVDVCQDDNLSYEPL